MGACYTHIDFKERVKLFDLAGLAFYPSLNLQGC
ncbi:hypothetical protein AEAC466_16700 [Asticcacaulis sp. AC466]|nr:hypothetical protein AEAC466_16700 [Asticcacaulis sp. AC466]